MIDYYEEGKHLPRESTSIVKLAEYFKGSTDYLFGLSNVKNHERLSMLIKSYESLHQEGQKELIDYLGYLNLKFKKK